MALSSAPFLSSLIDAAHDLIKNPSNLNSWNGEREEALNLLSGSLSVSHRAAASAVVTAEVASAMLAAASGTASRCPSADRYAPFFVSAAAWRPSLPSLPASSSHPPPSPGSSRAHQHREGIFDASRGGSSRHERGGLLDHLPRPLLLRRRRRRRV